MKAEIERLIAEMRDCETEVVRQDEYGTIIRTNAMVKSWADRLSALIAEAPSQQVEQAKALIEAERAEIACLYAGAEMEQSINIVASRMAQVAAYALDDLASPRSAPCPVTSFPTGSICAACGRHEFEHQKPAPATAEEQT